MIEAKDLIIILVVILSSLFAAFVGGYMGARTRVREWPEQQPARMPIIAGIQDAITKRKDAKEQKEAVQVLNEYMYGEDPDDEE